MSDTAIQYHGWNLEKTLLITNAGEARQGELIDVRLPLDGRGAGNLERDVRVLIKSDWNRIVREVPSQVYGIERHGAVAACRVAFVMDLPAHETTRIGVYYDNPNASAPDYQSPLCMQGGALGGKVATPFLAACFDDNSGQMKDLLFQFPLPHHYAKPLPMAQRVQEHASVVFAVKDRTGNVRDEYTAPAQWRRPEVIEDIRGPVFVKLVRRGRLAWPGCPAPECCPELTVGYRFFVHQPYFLVHTRLNFVEDTEVFDVQLGGFSVQPDIYTHYTFRPVSPSLPETDIEEMGHILIDPVHTADLPAGPALSGLIPYDAAWHGFIRARKGLDRCVSLIQLRHAASPGFPMYRAATYMFRQPEGFSCARAPVHVAKRCAENIVTIPAGAVIEELDAVVCDVFNADWGERTDRLGRRLNNPLGVNIHPRFMLGEVPPERWEPLPAGERAEAYRRFGVR